jgi:hypothetical protein
MDTISQRKTEVLVVGFGAVGAACEDSTFRDSQSPWC